MTVRDAATGNTLTSDNGIVVDGWKNNPDRFVPVKAKKGVLPSSDSVGAEDKE